MQNGIPFWYFHKTAARWKAARCAAWTEARLATQIPPERVIGCVVYPACELLAPGVVQHIEGDRFPLGELDGRVSDRVTRISEVFQRRLQGAGAGQTSARRSG
jgi:2-dehydropantoate 2-reductase